jgi:uncharacterized protein YuzE
MRFKYFPETDSLFIKFKEKKSVDSIEISSGVIADLDENDDIIGIEFYSVKNKIDLSGFEFEQMPVSNISFIDKNRELVAA